MLNEKRVLPDARLEQLIDMIGQCQTIADIGSDHGRLGACLLQSGRCERAIMTDISEASLKKAMRLIRLLDLEDKVIFRVGDGLSALEEPADVIVIAGMGGETIAEIMRGCDDLHRNSRFLLQANVAIPELRKALSDLGFYITNERLVRDGRRLYTIIETQVGNREMTDVEIEVGPILLEHRDPLLGEYAAFRLRVLGKALEGARKGSDSAAVETLERQRGIWEEIAKCL